MLNQRELLTLGPRAQCASVFLQSGILLGAEGGWRTFFQLITMTGYDAIRCCELSIAPGPLNTDEFFC